MDETIELHSYEFVDYNGVFSKERLENRLKQVAEGDSLVTLTSHGKPLLILVPMSRVEIKIKL